MSLTSAENTDIGVTADEVKLWGLNTDGIAARVSGANLDQTVTLAERIEMKGAASLGLETLFADFMIGYVEGVAQSIEAVAPEDDFGDEDLAELRAAMEMMFTKYEVSVDQIVAVKPKFRPWELSEFTPEDALEDEENAPFLALQKGIAYYRAFGVDEFIWSDANFAMDFEQDGIRQTMDGRYGFMAYSDWYGGDIREAIITDVSFGQDVDLRSELANEGVSPDEVPDEFQSVRMDFVIESNTYKNMKLDNVLRHVALGEWPSTEDTDLLSYGWFDMYGLEMALNGSTLFGVEEIIVDLSNWHWFIPESGELTLNGLTYDFDGIVDFMRPMMEAEDPDAMQVVETVMNIARKYEALPFIYDQSYVWDWSPETGEFSFKAPQKHHNFGEAEFEISGFLPTYEEGVAAVREDMAYVPDPDADIYEEMLRETAWEKLVEDTFTVTGGLLVLDDKGGLDNLFPLISEIGKLNPDEAGPMIANSTPDALRQAAVSAIGLAAIESGKEFPQAENWIMPFADWVRDGGKFTILVEPSEPLGARLEKRFADLGPDEAVELLGITVTHEVP